MEPRTKINNVHKKKKSKNKHKKVKNSQLFVKRELIWYFCLKVWKVFDQLNEIKGQKNAWYIINLILSSYYVSRLFPGKGLADALHVMGI